MISSADKMIILDLSEVVDILEEIRQLAQQNFDGKTDYSLFLSKYENISKVRDAVVKMFPDAYWKTNI